MYTELLLLLFGFLIGVTIVSIVWMIVAKEDQKRTEDMVQDATDSWCENNCKLYEQFFNYYEDPDDAWKHLDDAHCSKDCPLIEAQMIIFRERYKK